MSTTNVIGFTPGYTQPTLGGSMSTPMATPGNRPIKLMGILSLAVMGIGSTTSNSLTSIFASFPDPSVFEFTSPTNPLPYEAAIKIHSKLASIFYEYDIKNIDSKFMNDYLKLDSKELSLLKWLPATIKSIFGDVQVAIQSLIPIESGDPVLEVKIASELPLDEAFDRNEKALFKKIDDLSLADALGNIVITYA